MKKYLAGMMALVLATGCGKAATSTSIQPTHSLTARVDMLKVYVIDTLGDMESCSVKIDCLEVHKAGSP